MRKGDRITIAILVVLGAAAYVAIGVLTLLEASEYIEFAIAMAMFVAILVGSYLFVITPQKQREEERSKRTKLQLIVLASAAVKSGEARRRPLAGSHPGGRRFESG